MCPWCFADTDSYHDRYVDTLTNLDAHAYDIADRVAFTNAKPCWFSYTYHIAQSQPLAVTDGFPDGSGKRGGAGGLG